MGKITRLGEASHVTTVVPEPGGDPEIIPQIQAETGPRGETEGQTGNENSGSEVTYGDEPTEDELREVGVDPEGNVTDEHRSMVSKLREQRAQSEQVNDPTRATGPEHVGHDTFDPSEQLTEGQKAQFEATGDAEVVEGEEPPINRSTADVQNWVGDDPVKADRALDAERRNKNRSGLVSWLEKVARSR
jgi:hypothetical protein